MVSRTVAFLGVACFVLVEFPAAQGQEFTHIKLKRVVERALATNSIQVQRAEFTTDSLGLFYNFGGVVRPTSPSRTPLQIPTDVQFKIELLRRYPWRPINRRLWGSYLPKAERVVDEQLALIRKFKGDAEKLLESLQDLEIKADTLLREAANVMAQREGKMLAPVGTVFIPTTIQTPSGPKVVYVMETRYTAYAKGYKVAIKTAPSLAQIFYLTQADYEIAEESGVADQDTAWNRTSEGDHFLGGMYYFRANWPDGKKASAGRWPIKSERTITLTPD